MLHKKSQRIGGISLLSSFDWLLALSVFALMVLGLSAQYGITLGIESESLSIFSKQLIALAIGLIVATVLMLWNYRLLQSYAGTLYAFGAILLIGVLFFGVNRRGTTGWFDLGIVDVQPVEIAKIVLVIAIAALLAQRRQRLIRLKEAIITGIPVAIYVFFVMMQPDFGSAALMIGVWLVLVLMAGLDRKVLFSMIGIGLISIAMSWAFIFQDFQKERVLTFLQPDRDPLGIGYNVTQARIAIGSGRLWGRGLGFGSQSQLQFLPEAQTDFIFAAIAEELGFVGVSLVIGAFVLFFWRLRALLLKSRDDFTMFLLLGLGALLGIQVVVNIGMNLGMLPVTGLPLPYVSYGGSSLIASFMIFGIMESVAIRSRGG
jgi:rod shape determining protein RodA